MKNYNPYRILGLESACPLHEVKKRYRAIALQVHPDRRPVAPNAAQRFKLATDAYQFLADPSKKKEYDAELVRRKRKEYKLEHTEVRKMRRGQKRGVYSRRNVNDYDFNAFIHECRKNFREFFSKVERLK